MVVVGGQVSRTCDTETGMWSAIDFSECTLPPPQNTFVILWLTMNTGNVRLVENRAPEIERDVSVKIVRGGGGGGGEECSNELECSP